MIKILFDYLKYFEVARIEWLNKVGISYAQMEKDGIMMPVISASLNFKKPLYFGDAFKVTVNLKNLPKNQLRNISKQSLIREKIKKIELLKFYDFEKADKYSDQLLRDFYKRLNFKSENDFNSYLISYNLSILDIFKFSIHSFKF